MLRTIFLLPSTWSTCSACIGMLTAGFIAVSTSLAAASQPPDGGFLFDHAPRLVQTETSGIAVTNAGGTAYEFTLTVPKDAGAPLQAVTIGQDANSGIVEFAPNQSRAVAANGTNIPLASIGGTSGTEIAIAFERPIQPGETVTVLLKADRNPSSAGIYLFGITAYSVGNQSNGLFLGYGRVRVYSYGS